MVVEEPEQRFDVAPVGAPADLVGLSVPRDEPRRFELRQVTVVETHFERVRVRVFREQGQRIATAVGSRLVNWIVAESDGRVRFEENDPDGSVIRLQFEPAAVTASADSTVPTPVTDGTPS